MRVVCSIHTSCPIIVWAHTCPPELVQQTQCRHTLYCAVGQLCCVPQVVEQAEMGSVVGGARAIGEDSEALMGEVVLLLGGECCGDEDQARVGMGEDGVVWGGVVEWRWERGGTGVNEQKGWERCCLGGGFLASLTSVDGVLMGGINVDVFCSDNSVLTCLLLACG